MISPQPSSTQSHDPNEVHPHPIRWDIDKQLWVCSRGLCDFTRPKRPAEVVPSREEALQEALHAGTGADFADLRDRPSPATQPRPAGESAPAPQP